MVKELTTQEIATCHGGVNIVERIHGKVDSAFIAAMAAVGTFVIFHGYAGSIQTASGAIVPVLSIPTVLIATYYYVVGTKYTVDLDATATDG